MLKVTVQRSGWLRGEGSGNSYLHRESDKKMCCLGFACTAAGLSVDAINALTSPAEVVSATGAALPPSLENLVIIEQYEDGRPDLEGANTGTCEELMEANDNMALDAAAREAKITKLGALAGIAFTFVD